MLEMLSRQCPLDQALGECIHLMWTCFKMFENLFENNGMFYIVKNRNRQATRLSSQEVNIWRKTNNVLKHNISRQHFQCKDLYLMREGKPLSTVSAGLRRQLKIKMNIVYLLQKETNFFKFGLLLRLPKKKKNYNNPTYMQFPETRMKGRGWRSACPSVKIWFSETAVKKLSALMWPEIWCRMPVIKDGETLL